MSGGEINHLRFLLTADGKQFREEVEQSRKSFTGLVDPMKAKLASGAGGMAELSGAASRMSANMELAVRGVQTLLGLQVVSWAKEGAASLFEASAAAERLRIGLDFASVRGSADEVAYLRKTTDALGLSFSSTAQSYMQFQAAAKGTAMEGDKARTVFESVAKASAVMGLSADQNSGVLLALQQMVSKGTVQAEELRGQLGERLPGAFQIAARSMGVTTAELGKMLEMGQVISDDFLPKFAAELDRSLGGAAENAANRLDAAVNRLDNAWDRLKQKVGDSGVSKAMASEMTAVSRDIISVTETIERASAEGSGALSSLSQGALVAAGRAGFASLNLAANTLNGSINLLTGDLLGLSTNLALLPDALKTNAEQAKALGIDMEEAQTKLKRLQELDAMPSNGNYFKTAIAETNAYIEKLRLALALRGGLSADGLAPFNGRDREAGNSRGNRTAYNNAQFDSQKFLAERNDKINKSFIADIDGLAKAYATGTLSATEYAAAVNEVNKSRYASTDAGKAEAAALKDAKKNTQSAYDSLIASIRTKREQVRQELDDDTKLTESQKLRIKLDQDLAQGKIKLSASGQAAVRAELDLWAAEEKRVEARKGKKLTDELLSANAPLAADFAEKWKLLSSAYDDTEEGLQRLIKAQAVLLAQQPFAQQATALAQARAEAEQYLAVMQQAQAREVAAVGMGGRRAEYQSGLNQIEDTYAGRRYDLSRDMQQTRVRNGGSVSPQLQAYYDQQFELINEFERKAKASYASTFQAIGEAQASWGNGARRAFDDYIASAANVADQTASLFTRAFQGMEDALVSFAMTGKADFKSMAESIIADLIRIQIRASMMQVQGGASGGGGLLGALVGGVSALLGGTSAGAAAGASGASYSLTTGSNYSAGGLGLSVSGGRADGGSVAAGSMYEVNERGIPELLNIGQRQYLMMGQQSGNVVPLGNYGGTAMQAGNAGNRPTVEINIHNHTGAQVEQTSRTGADGKEIIDVIIKRAVGAVAGQLADDSGEVGQAMRARKQMGMAV